jgi:hypothetical protein
VTLAWNALNELNAYRVTEIPRRSDADASRPALDQPNDAGRTQRLAALIAAYHAGGGAKENGSSALAIGWKGLARVARFRFWWQARAWSAVKAARKSS